RRGPLDAAGVRAEEAAAHDLVPDDRAVLEGRPDGGSDEHPGAHDHDLTAVSHARVADDRAAPEDSGGNADEDASALRALLGEVAADQAVLDERGRPREPEVHAAAVAAEVSLHHAA